MDLDLEGKVALVTAASRGLGFAVASRLVSEGASVAISARDDEGLARAVTELEGAGGAVMAHPADLGQEDQVQALLDAVLERYGRIDILVCNTGGPGLTEFMQTTTEDWQEALRTMFFPVLQLVRGAVPSMRENGGGRIIFLTSTWVKQPRPGGILSSVVRSAVSGLSKQLAGELAPDDILVNQVMPGPAWTDRSKQITARLAEVEGITVEEVKERIGREIPLGRYARPEEVADAVAFLASGRGSFITGTAMQVDGGQIRATL